MHAGNFGATPRPDRVKMIIAHIHNYLFTKLEIDNMINGVFLTALNKRCMQVHAYMHACVWLEKWLIEELVANANDPDCY